MSSDRPLPASASYKAWTLLLAAVLLGTSFLTPAPARATPVDRAATSATRAASAAPPDDQAAKYVSGRSEYTRTEANPDGSYSFTSSLRPLHWKEKAADDWREFDDRLKLTGAADAEYDLENTAAGYEVRFGKLDKVKAGGRAVLFEADGASVGITPVGAKPKAKSATIGQNSVTYEDAWPGVDMRLTVDHERVKEDLVIKAAPSGPLSFAFDLDLDGISEHKQPNGSVDFRDAAGTTVLRTPAPFLEDAGDRQEGAAGVRARRGVARRPRPPLPGHARPHP